MTQLEVMLAVEMPDGAEERYDRTLEEDDALSDALEAAARSLGATKVVTLYVDSACEATRDALAAVK